MAPKLGLCLETDLLWIIDNFSFIYRRLDISVIRHYRVGLLSNAKSIKSFRYIAPPKYLHSGLFVISFTRTSHF
jgi:hypothetical protein